MEHIIKDITEKISTKEPLYKVVVAIPSYSEDEGEITLDVKIKSYIYNYSTYKENSFETSEEYLKTTWERFIDKNINYIRLSHLCEEEKYNEEVGCHKLSVELLN